MNDELTSAPAARPRVLIVEDDPGYANRLQRNLESAGMLTHIAGDVPRALELLAEKPATRS